MLQIKLFLSATLLSLVSCERIAVESSNLLKDLLQEYPGHTNCDLQYVTDQPSKFDSLFSTTVDAEMNLRAVSLWTLSLKQDNSPNQAVFSRGHSKCEMVFVDADQLLTTDFIKHIHSRGLLGQTHFYAIKLESVQSLRERNTTEIYDFTHLIFLVDKVNACYQLSSSFYSIKRL